MTSRKPRDNRRRGSVYVIVLGTAMCVATIGLAAILSVRVDRRRSGDSVDTIATRYYARAAIEMGFQIIHDDPSWRTTYPNGVWLTNVPFADGDFSLTVTDPEDGNLATAPNNFLVMTGTGIKSGASYSLRATVETLRGGFQIQSGSWQRVVP